MFRVLLLSWYTLTALAGPALCCCSAQAIIHGETAASETNHPAPPVKKSCCQPSEGSAKTSNSSKNHQNGHPDECPCKKQPKKDHDRASPAGNGVAEASGQARPLDCSFFDSFSLASSLTRSPVDRGCGSPPNESPALAGRDLLAAYHILRC